MRGLYLQDGKLHYRDDLPRPEAREGYCRVRVLQAGICATDLALQRGYMGFAGTPGHEFVGVAREGPLVGRRVVGEINASCGTCGLCVGGDERHCPNRTVLGILNHPGAFAEEISLPAGNLHAVPEGLGTEAAAFAEPLAAAFEIPEQVKLGGQRGLVAGDGKLGILCAHVLALHGVEVTVAGRHRERVGLLPAGSKWCNGVEDCQSGFDLVVEATGQADVLPRILRLVRPRGTVVLKTTTEKHVHGDLSLLVVNEVTLVGSRCGPFAPALQALTTRSVPVEKLIQGRYPLEQGEEAFARARQGSLKVMLDVSRS